MAQETRTGRRLIDWLDELAMHIVEGRAFVVPVEDDADSGSVREGVVLILLPEVGVRADEHAMVLREGVIDSPEVIPGLFLG